MVQNGTFRQDLYYRLCAITVTLPPLRDRNGDVALLAQHFIEKHSSQLGMAHKSMSPSFQQALELYDWPGNVRELSNVIHSSVALSLDDDVLELYHLPVELRVNFKKHLLEETRSDKALVPDLTPLKQELGQQESFPSFKQIRSQVVNEVERLYFTQLLSRIQDGQEEACRISGLSRARLYELLKKHNLTLR